MLGEAHGGIVSKAELHAIGVEFGYELHYLEDANGLVGLSASQVVTLLSPGRANAVCLFGSDSDDQLVARIMGMPLLRGNTQPQNVSPEVGPINTQFSCEKPEGYKLIRCFHVLIRANLAFDSHRTPSLRYHPPPNRERLRGRCPSTPPPDSEHEALPAPPIGRMHKTVAPDVSPAPA